MARAKKLYTLTEASKTTGISMPTLQRYKKLYQERIPSEGEGRKQRYPKEALAVFATIRQENMKKRGRPAKAGKRASGKTKARVKRKVKAKAKAKSKAKAKAKAAAKSRAKTKRKARGKAKTRARTTSKARAGRKVGRPSAARSRSRKPRTSGATASGERKLLTLLEIGRRTGISYPTLVRYVKLYGKEIPYVGSGRRRRFPVEAVKVFRRLRRASKRGPRAGKKRAASATRRATGTDQALKARVRELEKAQRQVTRQLDEIVRLLKKPIRITVRS